MAMRVPRRGRHILHRHVLILVALQVARGLRLMPQALHAAHHIVGLRQEGVAQSLNPGGILPQRHQHLRKGDQRLHARVPGLTGYFFDCIIAFRFGVRFRPGDGLGDFPWVGAGHQHLCKEWVRIKGNRRQHLIQLLLSKDRILGGRRHGWRIGSGDIR